MWRYIFSLLAVCVGLVAVAQEAAVVKAVDKITEEPHPKFAPRFVQFNYNILRFGENLLDKPQTSQEIQAELGIHKYLLVADLGFAQTDRGTDYSYQSEGNYWRVGLDANMSAAWKEGQVLAIGLRYARANYGDQTTFTRVFGENGEIIQEFAFENTELSSRWAELIFKMRVPFWKGLSTGYTMRYQFLLVTQGLEGSQLQPFDIPGYGRTNRPSSFGFDFYLGWRIDLSRSKSL
jgi:hypothetical protein